MEEVRLAIVSRTRRLATRELKRAVNAIQAQITRDFAPAWQVSAHLERFASADDVPLGYWPVTIDDDIGDAGMVATHSSRNGVPYGLIVYDEGWSLSASHTILEMLVAPFGDRFIQGPSIHPPTKHPVRYLVQVCDPCEDRANAYEVDGVVVSDFCTPDFWDSTAKEGRFSFTGAVRRPRQVLRGGYLSWQDPATREWWQKVWFGARPSFQRLGVFEGGTPANAVRLLDELQELQQPRIAEIRQSVEALIRLYGER
jgi:hypothetical protein